MKRILFYALIFLLPLAGRAQATAYPVSEIAQCDNHVFNLTVHYLDVLGNQSPNAYTVTYFTSEADAVTNTNVIANPGAFTSITDQQIFVRVSNIANDDFDITSFAVITEESPEVGQFDNVTACAAYTLPALTWPAFYYTAPNGVGQLPAGTVVTASTTIYVYATNGLCQDETSFTVTITGSGNGIVLPNAQVTCVTGDEPAIFNLDIAEMEIVQFNPSAIDILFFETQADAQAGTNPIVNQSAYMSVGVWQQTLYVRMAVNGCMVVLPIELVIVPCDATTTLSGTLTYDVDGNGCGLNDGPAAQILVGHNYGNDVQYTYTDINGHYVFYNVPLGVNTVWVQSVNGQSFSANPGSVTVDLANGGDPVNDFCLSTTAPFTDVAVYATSYSQAVPGFSAYYAIVYYNAGTLPASGTVNFTYDTTKLSNPVTANMTSAGNTLSLNYTNLLPFESHVEFVQFTVATPPTANSGDVLTFTAAVTPVTGDVNTNNDTFIFNQAIVNSFDPNDISVKEGENITIDHAADFLHYTIRFQNTGTANAQNIKVMAALDDNLDWSTFEPIGGSHLYHTNRTANAVEFVFENIQLPAQSANEAASQGFVSYRIKPKATVAIGDSMAATGYIYFDFNEAIVTNTVTTTVQAPAGLTGLDNNLFTLYPNPASGRVTLQLQNANVLQSAVNVTDVLGKKVLNTIVEGNQPTLNVSMLKTGVYFVTVITDGKQVTKKLIIK